jgi:hypothetical protein
MKEIGGVDLGLVVRRKPKEYVRTNQDFRQLLCSYVDMWLETGRERDGTDRPSTRKPTMDIQAIVNG